MFFPLTTSSFKINSSDLFVYLFGFVATIFSLRLRAFSDVGDAPAYMRLYTDYLNGIEWPIILAEPTFMLAIKLASFIGEFGIFIILSALITLMVYLIARIHSIHCHSVFLFFLISQLPFIKSYNFLLNAWRTSLSISLAYLFIYVCMHVKPREFLLLKTFLFFPVIVSHASGPLLILFYFISTYYRRVVTSLSKFRFNRKIFFIVFILVTLYIFYFFASNEISYFIRRLDYADSNYIHETKSIFSLYTKIALLFSLAFYLKSFLFLGFALLRIQSPFVFSCILLIFALLGSFVSTISDRVINCTYWISVLFFVIFFIVTLYHFFGPKNLFDLSCTSSVF